MTAAFLVARPGACDPDLSGSPVPDGPGQTDRWQTDWWQTGRWQTDRRETDRR
jgi:hypothetical protein